MLLSFFIKEKINYIKPELALLSKKWHYFFVIEVVYLPISKPDYHLKESFVSIAFDISKSLLLF